MSVRLPASVTSRVRRAGVTFGFNARNGYFSTGAARREIENMASLGVRWCVLTPTVFQDTASSEVQYRHFDYTPDDGELRRIIDLLHEHGICVHLRPMLETLDGHGRNQIWFPRDRERIPGRPSRHRAAWFDGFASRTLHYARIAQECGCEWYGLDSELDRMVEENDHWKRVIAAARSVYDGPVDSCHTPMTDVLAELRSRPDHWFYDLDGLSVSFYRSAATGPGATVEQMVQKLSEWLPYYRDIAVAFDREGAGKPFWFGETGCTSSTGGAISPSGWSGKGGYAPDEQTNFLEALCRVFSGESWWRGFYWWKWDEQLDRAGYKDDPAGDKGFTLWQKPAAGVYRQWREKLEAPAPDDRPVSAAAIEQTGVSSGDTDSGEKEEVRIIIG
ncbi:hypothetical protein OpiT1DRAFT_04199 [Opitutaceae bacterium TAV1]|nr:hypothetical protein OpiT1DRAFT_04199 [Opitutaceae bacterium TAV1]